MRAVTREKTASKHVRLGFHLVGVGLTTAAAVAVAAPAWAQPLDPGPQLMAAVPPMEVDDNPTFTDLDFECDFTLKVEPVTEGTFGPVTISDIVDDQVFDFSISGDLVATGVIVKGGPNANLYDYRPIGIGADMTLHAPLNLNSPNPFDFYELSHVDFCLVEDGYNGDNGNGNSTGRDDRHHA